jgi:predicted nucleotidyltransferase
MTQFDPIFAALQATGVRYVVVGGVAVNLHGYQRFTKDIDLVVEFRIRRSRLSKHCKTWATNPTSR